MVLYVRARFGKKHLNLLLRLDREGEALSRVQALMSAYADPSGALAYFDPDKGCIAVLRSRDLEDLCVYYYDDVAPYDGVLLGDRWEAIWEA